MNSVIVSCLSCGKKNRVSADKQHLQPKCGHCGASINLTSKAVPVELNDQNFHEFIKNASLPVMVDFFSPSCGPCQMMTPVVDALAQKHVNTFIITKIDISQNPQIAAFFNIRGVPTFYFFKKGSLIDQLSGAVSEGVLNQKLAQVK